MAITITKSKTVQSIAPVTKVESKTKPVSKTTELVNELIGIQAKLDAIGAGKLIKKADEIKKSLQQVMADSGADKDLPYTFKTSVGAVEFGPCSTSIEVEDKALMIKLLGIETFKTLAKVGVTDMRTYLSGVEIAQFTKSVRGSRSIKSIRFGTT